MRGQNVSVMGIGMQQMSDGGADNKLPRFYLRTYTEAE